MATELAKAYVQIIPSAQGIQGSISDVIGGEATSAGQSGGEKYASGFASKLKGALVGLGIAKILKDSIENASEFETAMAKVNTLFTGSADEFGQLKEDILGLSSAYGLGADTLAEAAYSAESAGVSMEDLTEMLEGSAKLATAGFTDIDTALSATAKTMNAYGKDAKMLNGELMDSEKVQKVLIQTQNLGITTVDELGASLANVTPTAAAMGVSFDQVGAAMAQLTAAGVPTAQATTQLRSAMVELGKSGTKADKAFREAAKGTEYAGMSFQEAMDAGANLGDVFGMMQTYADSTGQSMVDLWGSVEAGNAAMLIASDVEKFNSNLEEMGTDADVVGEAYGKMADTFGNSMNRLKESAKSFMITLFEGGDITTSFQNMLDAAGDIGGKLITWVTNGVKTLGENLPGMINSLLDFGAGLLEALGNVNWIDLGVSIINGLLSGLGTLGERLIKFVGDAIMGVATGDIDFAAIGRAIWDGITSILGTAGDVLKTLFEDAKNLICGENGVDFSGIGSQILDGIKGIIDSVTEFFDTVFSQGVKEAQNQDWPSVGEVIKTGVNLILRGGQFLSAIFVGGAQLIKNIDWESVGQKASQLITTGLDNATMLVNTIGDASKRLLTSVSWETIGQGITDLIDTGLKGGAKLVETIATAADQLLTSIHWADIGSGISRFLETGLKGGANLLESGFRGAVSFLEGVDWAGLGATISSGLGTAFSGLGDFLGGLLTGSGAFLQGTGEGAGSVMHALGAAIADMIHPEDVTQATADLKQAAEDLDTALKNGEERLLATAKGIGSGILSSIKEELTPANVTAIGTSVTDNISTGLSATYEMTKLASSVETIKTGIKTPLQGTDNEWSDLGGDIVGKIESGIGLKNERFQNSCGALADNAITTMKNRDWMSVGTNIVDGIVSGINSAAGRLYSTMEQIARNALAAAKRMLGIASPSKVMRDQIGRWIPEGIAAGMERYSGTVDSAMNDMLDGMATTGLQGTLAVQSRGFGQNTSSGSQEEQIRLLREQNSLLRAILEKDNSVKFGPNIGLARTVNRSMEMLAKVGG